MTPIQVKQAKDLRTVATKLAPEQRDFVCGLLEASRLNLIEACLLTKIWADFSYDITKASKKKRRRFLPVGETLPC